MKKSRASQDSMMYFATFAAGFYAALQRILRYIVLRAGAGTDTKKASRWSMGAATNGNDYKHYCFLDICQQLRSIVWSE